MAGNSGPTLGKGYVQIIPSARGITGQIKSALSPEANSAGAAAGSSIVGKIKGALAVGGIGLALKKSLDVGGALQQSFGGIDTIYGSAKTKKNGQEAVKLLKQYSQEAQRAGVSANSYAEQAVSFGASLKSAFGGDMVKAAKTANTAILDMTDNAAKMGTPMESIQNAYQGFAKQNYTMLDNLKLGYGGTKKEMERLLADAEKLTGKKYDISNLGDVYNAIHVIQKELGLSGTAAKEAAETYTGSFGSMKAAAENLLGALSFDQIDLKPQMQALVGNATAFLFNNLVPMVGRVIKTVPTAVKTFFEVARPLIMEHANSIVTYVKDTVPKILSSVGSYFSGTGFSEMANNAVSIINGFIDGIAKNAPSIISKGGEFITNLVTGISNAAPTIITGASSIIQHLATGIMSNIPNIITVGIGIVKSIASAVRNNLPVLASEGIAIIKTLIGGVKSNVASQLPLIISTGKEFVSGLVDSIKNNVVANIPQFVSTGKEFISGLISGFTGGIPSFLEKVLPMIESFTGTIRANAGTFISAGLELIVQLAQGLMTGLPALIQYVPSIVSNIAGIINDNVPTVLQAGWNLIKAIGQGVINAVPALIDNFPAIIGAIIDVWSAVNWVSLGTNLINLIKNGVSGLFHAIPTVLKNIGNNAMNTFKSISWSSVGTAVINFIKGGISGLASVIPNALRSIGSSAMSAFKSISWSSVGSHIISGIVSGITGAAGALFGSLKNLASNALSAAKNALEIKSPSRKFANLVGAFIPSGIASGIKNHASDFTDAVDDLVNSPFDKDVVGNKLQQFSGRESAGGNSKVVELLDIIAKKELKVGIGNREFTRSLEDVGVAFT